MQCKKFLDFLKLSDITPVYRKLDPSDKAKSRPFSPLLLKVFEKIIYDQIYAYLENFLSDLLCRFQKTHSTQHALLRLIQKWQAELDSGGGGLRWYNFNGFCLKHKTIYHMIC